MSKKIIVLLLGVMLLGGTYTVLAAAASTNLTAALQAALFEEEANHDLEAAIQAYKSVAAQFDQDRKLAGTAIFRLGECYRKQGKTNEARACYDRVVKEFGNLTNLSSQSQQQLASLGVKPQAASEEVKEARPSSTTFLLEIERNELRRLQKLLEDSPDLLNAGNVTPLHDAVIKNYVNVARFLLTNGVDVNPRRQAGTPLHLAAESGNLEMTRLLLQFRADPNATIPDSPPSNQTGAPRLDGQTPLHLAAQRGYKGLAETLLLAGANANAQDKSGATPLHLAAGAGHFLVAELLIANKADVGMVSQSGLTPLHAATEQGHTAMSQLLIKRGANINAKRDTSPTPLGSAVAKGHVAVIKLLLENKADPNIPKGVGDTVSYPLHDAIKSGAESTISLLLENGANPNVGMVKENNTYPALQYAVHNFPACVPLLLKHKADPNLAAKPWGETPLLASVKNSQAKVVEWLLNAKANVNIQDSSGNTALHYALGQPEILRKIISSGADLNATNEFGETPLHLAAASDLTSAAEFLLQNNAKPNLQDQSGSTPAHHAVLTGSTRTLELLLSRGAEPNVRDQRGNSPLSMVTQSSGPHYQLATIAPGVRAVRNVQFSMRSVVSRGEEAAKLLRAHGALDLLPEYDKLKIGREDSFSTAVTKDQQGWNRYTLLEVIGLAYGLLEAAPADAAPVVSRPGAPPPMPVRPPLTPGTLRPQGLVMNTSFSPPRSASLPFPDFSNVKIRRPVAGPEVWRILKVNVAKILASGDCLGDVPLEWGDIVEIPEADHVLNAIWEGFSNETGESLNKCLSRTIDVVVKGKTNQLNLVPNFRHGISYTAAGMWIYPVLQNSKLLLSSSDLSRIKVTRRSPLKGEQKEFLVDCRNPQTSTLWLRDGDIIEVPDN